MYITLPSNASTDDHPSNSANSYVVKLPERLELGPGWTVGLAEMHFPTRSVAHSYRIPLLLPKPKPLPKLGPKLHVEVPRPSQQVPLGRHSHFTTKTQGFTAARLNDQAPEGAPPAVYAPPIFENTTSETSAKEPSRDASGLGFVQALYVYCDVATPQIVGNVRAPLLRIVKPHHDPSELSTVVLYDNPHYVPLSKREFTQIEIDIRDEAGEPAAFAFGTTIVTLHFKRQWQE